MKPVRIVLADDHHLVRAGILALLAAYPDLEIVGETGNGEEALRLVGELQPDMAILDIAMPGITGLQVLSQIRERSYQTWVIVLSMHATEEHVNSAMRLGANGYVLKNAAPRELYLAIQTVLTGGTWLPASISRQMVDAYLERAAIPGKHGELTPRQEKVLKMIVEGYRTKEIAFDLEISIKTVETYRAQIMEKLGVQDIPGLVRYAIRNGISEL